MATFTGVRPNTAAASGQYCTGGKGQIGMWNLTVIELRRVGHVEGLHRRQVVGLVGVSPGAANISPE
jgi:hypothetical protein